VTQKDPVEGRERLEPADGPPRRGPLRRLADWAAEPVPHQETHARQERLRRQQQGLVAAATSDALRVGDVPSVVRQLTELAARTMGVQRVGVWWLVEGGSKLVCTDLYELGADRHSHGVEIVGSHFPDYFQALQADRVVAAHDAHADPRTRELSEAYLTPLGISSMLDASIRRGGETIGVVCHEHVGPLRHWSEEDQHFAGTIADHVTIALEAAARHDAESALRQHETLFRVLVEHSSDIVAVLSPDGAFRYLSPSVTRTMGYEPDGLVGQSVFSFVHADDVALARERFCGDALESAGAPHRCRVLHSDGSWRTMETLTRSAVVAPAVNGIVLNARDVTRLVELEDSLRHTQLLSAMGSLVAGVAHEVRNPLFGMTASLDAFEALHPLDHEARAHVDVLRRQLDRLSRLMRDLLEYGRPRQITRADHTVAEVVEQAEQACRADASCSPGAITVRLPSGLPPVFVDAARMAQAIGNLLQNALEHSPPGAAVTVEALWATDRGRPGVAITVEDAGPGFRDGDLARVFEPFYSLRKGGTGLGLSIVHRIVEEHGGRVVAENRSEGGGRVRLWLPSGGGPERDGR